MTIASILRGKGHDVVTVRIGQSVNDVLALLHRHRIGAVPVIDGERLAGIVSERDVVLCLHERGSGVLDLSVDDVMASPVVTVRPGDSVDGAMALMTERRIRHLPVCEGDQLVGVVSIGDLVKRRIEEIEAESRALKDYIATA